MLVVIGKTASGKTTIVDKLVAEYGYRKIVTTTSRPIRKKEKQGVDYNFISEEEFKNKIEDGTFAEWKCYHTVDGDWYYGCYLNEIVNAGDKDIIILTPDGYRDVCYKSRKKLPVIYIYANIKTIETRLKKRGDKKEEAQRRIEHDNQDFKGAEELADRIFYNNETNDVDEVTRKIVEYLENR